MVRGYTQATLLTQDSLQAPMDANSLVDGEEELDAAATEDDGESETVSFGADGDCWRPAGGGDNYGLDDPNQVNEQENENYAGCLVGRVFDATITQVPGIIDEMKAYRAWTDPLLKEEKEKSANDARKQLHASLALLPVDAGQVDYLYERLLKGEPQEVVVIREALLGHKADLTEHCGRCWRIRRTIRTDAFVRPVLGGFCP